MGEVVVVPLYWTPVWADPWLKARYTPLVHDPETGLVEQPQKIVMWCERCGDRRELECPTGTARTHIQKYCVVHPRVCGGASRETP